MPDTDTIGIESSIYEDEVPSDPRVQGALSFIRLCQLTVILGEVLPMIYTLKPQDSDHALRILRRHEMSLDEWEQKLPNWLRPGSGSFDRKAAGALNLQLCYLVTKMCLWRIGLLVIIT